MTSEAGGEGKYTLEYFTSAEREGDEPPFKYRTFYLDDALAEAWRIDRGGGEALCIKSSGEAVFDRDSLTKTLERISELGAGGHDGGERKLAAVVLGELGKSEGKS